MPRTRNLSTGNLAGHLMQLAIPAGIGMLFTTLYNVVDVFFAGLIGTEAQAGLAISFQAFFIFIAFGFGLSAAMAALVGNATGAKDFNKVFQIANKGIGFGLLVSLLLIFIALWVGPLLIKLISTEGAYREIGIQYFNILTIAIPSFVMSFGINGLLQSQGDTISMQRAQIGAFFANVGLNPLLVFGIPGFWSGMGFDGIAVATVISQTGVLIYVGNQLFKSELMTGWQLVNLTPNLATAKSITGQMLPITLTMVVMMTSGFIVQYYLKSFGIAAVAAYGVALRVEQLFLLPVFGLTGALLPIVAQNYGADEKNRTRQALFICWKFGFIFMAIACPILFFASPLLMRMFTSDVDVIKIGVSYLRIDGFILPIYMMLFAINSFLQALKKPIWTLWIGIYRQSFGVAFFSWIFVYLLDFGVVGVWLGIATSVLTGLILSLIITRHVANRLLGRFW
jgi:putative MATE family efflux protein